MGRSTTPAKPALNLALSSSGDSEMKRTALTCMAVASLGCGVRTTPSPEIAQEVTTARQRGIHLIPQPVSTTVDTGRFVFTPGTIVVASRPELLGLARHAEEMLEPLTGSRLEVRETVPVSAGQQAVFLRLHGAGGPESYRLRVTPDSVTVTAPGAAGVFYGLQTLRQLVTRRESTASLGSASLPALLIEDRPRFAYRGMHLDVARHFFSVEFIKRYIDLLAMYKLNRFHWHLTDDQGWRIEIEKYPRLTTVGAHRRETILEKNFDPYIGDGKPHGGYYTQDEVREVVAYAQSRYVTVIPEIELPGHSTAALAAYPELACTQGPFEVSTIWGIHEDIYCPSDRTFAFLEDVLTEVLQLFPSRHIHIGGDEVPKTRWEESQLAQAVLEREGLADEAELQSYFIRRIEAFLREHGRRLVGWDEILEGGLAPDATVMSWRGMSGGIEAARQGHDVIMTPTSHLYFDYYQGNAEYEPLAIGGYTPLETVYEFEPVPEELTAEEAKHILGAQGNVWTEYVTTDEYVEYMVIPRVLALAEVVWSPKSLRNWDRFTANLPAHFRRLDALGFNYRVPQVLGLARDRLTLEDTVIVTLQAPIDDAEIRYTTDGSDPTPLSPVYDGPLTLQVDEAGTAVAARLFLRGGKASLPISAHLAKTTLRAAEQLDEEELSPGMNYRYYEARVSSVDEIAALLPSAEGAADSIGPQPAPREDHFALSFSGFIKAPDPGLYTLFVTSDDGSRLTIGDRVVVENDGLHSASERSGQIALEAGYHPFRLLYFQGGGGSELKVSIRRDGAAERLPIQPWIYRHR